MADDAGAARALEAGAELTPAQKRMPFARRLLLIAIALAVIAGAGAALHNWQTVGQYRQTTDNAYVRADISSVSAQVEGYVHRLAVAENQQVRAGDVLLEIDNSDFRAAVASAEANVARARAQVGANAAARRVAAAQLERSRFMAERGLISPAGLDTAEGEAVQTAGTTAAAQAEVAAAEAALAQARLNLERTIIRAPIDGIVGNRTVQVGQLVRPGASLMAIVPHTLYVEANYKETQLRRMRVGQRVEIRPDIDRSLRLTGVVESFAPASGSEFSFIPTETATGNFTKIVQRVPVRIRIDETPGAQALLRPGLSVTTTVITRDE
ncbi:MAG: efflux RND transporter periplasmic adaptor subunit [Hyphomonadaceae bacterium]